MKPNTDQVMSIVRAVLLIAGTMLVNNHVVTQTGWDALAGAVLMAAPVLWGLVAHTDNAALATVEAMPDVTKIVVKTTSTNGVATAAADPSRPKVVVTTTPIETALGKKT